MKIINIIENIKKEKVKFAISTSVILAIISTIAACGKLEHQEDAKGFLLIGSVPLASEVGSAYKCNTELTQCILVDTSNLNLLVNDSFGRAMDIGSTYTYINARDRNNLKGAIFKCLPDATQCSEINVTALALVNGQNFGISLTSNSINLYAGSTSSSYSGVSTGVVYKCDLEGQNCQIINPVGLGMITNSYFGAAVTISESNNKLYIGAPGPYSSAGGGVFICDLNGANCSSINTSNLNLTTGASFGIAISAGANKLYIGARGFNSSTGTIFICNLDGTNCSSPNFSYLNLVANDNFGTSIFATNENLFIGALGRNSNKGAIFKCDLNGNNCIEKPPTSNVISNGFGASMGGITRY